MFTSFQLYQSFSSLVNTYQGSWFRPESDFIIQANDVSKEIWNDLTATVEKSQQQKDYLRPFLKTKNVIVQKQNKAYGFFTIPPTYERYSSARIIVHQDKTLPDKSIDNGKCWNGEIYSQQEISEEYYSNIVEREVDLIDNQKWGGCLQHLTKFPTFDNPKINQIDNGYRVAPRDVSVIVLDFYVSPKVATFLYTISPANEQTGAGDQLIYNPSSTPFDWPISVIPEFLYRLAQRYSLFVEREIIFSFASQLKQQNSISK